MWLFGNKIIPIYELYNLKHVKINAVWSKAVTPVGSPLSVGPLLFIYASVRTSILGPKIGLRGQLAGAALGSAALCYLTPFLKSAIALPPNSIFLHHNFYNAKDFIGASIKGTIGAALAYLEMQHLGYAWNGHWEDCVAFTGISADPVPDFVFASGTDVCLVDAKGSARPFPEVGKLAKSEWRRQIYPNRNVMLKLGGFPTEGRVIAASLVRPRAVGLVAAYGKFPAVNSLMVAPNAPITPGGLAMKSVQKTNFTNAFYLLGLNDMASSFIGGANARAEKQLSWALSRAEYVDAGEAIFKGPSKVFDLAEGGVWIMQPFCRVDILRAAFLNLMRDDAPPVSSAALILPDHIENSKDSVALTTALGEQVIIQSRDGVGAIFKRAICK